MTPSYQWLIVQKGSLPLAADDHYRAGVPHACTSVLVWPEGQPPGRDNALLTDPCFPAPTVRGAEAVLRGVGLQFDSLDQCFITHNHGDHVPFVPPPRPVPVIQSWSGPAPATGPFAGLTTVPCPGHSPDMTALVFRSGAERVWIVGDAVLDDEWLRAWNYFWPNGYEREEIIETWRSVARIVAGADVVIPGHGPPIRVTRELVQYLIDEFPRAEHYRDCPEVVSVLRSRLA